MDLGTAAAVMVGLKVVGEPAMNVAEDFAKRVFGPVADATGTALASPIATFNERRARRTALLLRRAAETMNERDVEIRTIPDYLMLPLIEHGSLVDDDDLRAVWAQLIASASSQLPDSCVLPSFPKILSELSPLEAKVLGTIYDVVRSRHSGDHEGVRLDIGGFVRHHGGSRDDARIVQDNFVRLQLLRPDHPVVRGDEIGKVIAELIQSRGAAVPSEIELEDNRFGGHTVTALGWAFLQACAGPRPADTANSNQANTRD